MYDMHASPFMIGMIVVWVLNLMAPLSMHFLNAKTELSPLLSSHLLLLLFFKKADKTLIQCTSNGAK